MKPRPDDPRRANPPARTRGGGVMSAPLTAEELADALHRANGDGSPESDDYRFPYIDAEHADVIDGGLSILCRWMVARFDVTPRAESPAAVSSAATGLADPREASRE